MSNVKNTPADRMCTRDCCNKIIPRLGEWSDKPLRNSQYRRKLYCSSWCEQSVRVAQLYGRELVHEVYEPTAMDWFIGGQT